MGSSFKLNLESSAHASLIQNTFQNWINSPRDVFFVSSEGHKLFLQSSVLRFYSSWMSDILYKSSPDVESTGITVEASSVTISKMFKVLTSGIVVSQCQEDLQKIIEVAASIGINLTNYQIGQKRSNDSYVQHKPIKKYKKRKRNSKEVNFEIGSDVSKNEYVDGENYLNLTVNGDNYANEIKTTTASVETSSKKKLKTLKNEYECNFCFKIIKGAMSHFKRHIDTHLGLRFRCKLCPKSFSRKDNLKLHYKFNHPEELPYYENKNLAHKTYSAKDSDSQEFFGSLNKPKIKEEVNVNNN